VSVELDPAVLSEAASLAAEALGLQAKPGAAFDAWGQAPAEMKALMSGPAWTAPLLGPVGQCAELSIVLPAGSTVDEAAAAMAISATVPALTEAYGADREGPLHPVEVASLLEARPGERALAMPLVGETGWSALIILASNPATAELPHLDPKPGPAAAHRSIAALSDVEMTVSVELGRTKIPIKDLLTVHNGSVVQLDRGVTQPVDIFVQGTLIARGEVVVVDEQFAVRVTELLTGE
jgi:flagellar motor switch protein FliN